MKKFIRLLIFLSVVRFAHATVVEGPLTNIITGHAYCIIAPKSWTNAEVEAKSLGGHLATIHDDSENTWIVNHLIVDFSATGGPNLAALPLWIGAYDPVKNDGNGLQHSINFVWASGESDTYGHWASGQPDNYQNVEYYTCINWFYAVGASGDHSLWNDTMEIGSLGFGGTSDGPYHGIVDLGSTFPFPLTNTPGTVLGPVTNSLNGHKYYLIPATNWTSAEAAAQRLGGHLATIRNDSENGWIANHLAVDFSSGGGPNLSNRPLWIGLYDPSTNDGVQHAANFIWASGEPSGYRHWDPGQPDNFQNGEYYSCINWHLAAGATGDRGFWNDAPLNGTTGFAGLTDGPYYGIAEVQGAGLIQIKLTNSVITITTPLYQTGSVLQMTANLRSPIQWVPVWTNNGTTPFTLTVGTSNLFFRLAQ